MADPAGESLPARAWRKLQTRGLRALPEAAGRRWRAWQAANRQARPVAWAHWGPLSRLLARAVWPVGPPALLLGHPRSGTSWVGASLGKAANALFLHEPINLSMIASGEVNAVYYIDPANPPAPELALAERAFAALPNFPHLNVPFPEQWRLAERPRRRLVLKEVNLYAAEFFARRYRPRVVLLVRHPAAVGLSHKKLGWWGAHRTWRAYAEHQGRALRYALDQLEAYGDYRVALYEDLCLDPVARFQDLFAYAGLEWGPQAEAEVLSQTSGEPGSERPWSLRRDSRRMARSWVGQIDPADVAETRAGYAPFGLPWYTADSDW